MAEEEDAGPEKLGSRCAPKVMSNEPEIKNETLLQEPENTKILAGTKEEKLKGGCISKELETQKDKSAYEPKEERLSFGLVSAPVVTETIAEDLAKSQFLVKHGVKRLAEGGDKDSKRAKDYRNGGGKD